MTETGPIYNVPLIDTLPLGYGGMWQQLPSRQDLEDVRTMSQRTVAGYEVLMKHYHEAKAKLDELEAIPEPPRSSPELENALRRLKAMTAKDQQTWDLSHNDTDAIRLVLFTLKKLLKDES